MASLHKVAMQHYSQVYTNACNKWQCTEAEVYAFQTERSLYNVRVFATLVLQAISHEATEYIKVATKNNLHLLNDGPFVWVNLFQYLFLSCDVYDKVIGQQIMSFPWPVATMTWTNILRSSCDYSSLLVPTCLWQTFMHTGTISINRSRSILLHGFDNTLPPRLSKATTSFAPRNLITWKMSQKIILIHCLSSLSSVAIFISWSTIHNFPSKRSWLSSLWIPLTRRLWLSFPILLRVVGF